MHFPRSLTIGFTFIAGLVLTPGLGAQVTLEYSTPPAGVSQSDWSGIRAAHGREQHQVLQTESGFKARNPGQAWSIDFDGQGFSVQPDSKAWTWGLQLESYGFAGSMLSVDGVACASSQGGRMAYDWNANVQEWYINDARGLEHGYTVRSRPARGCESDAPLVFDLEVRGSLQAEALGDGNGVRFVDAKGVTAVTYAGLHVFDAMGNTQLASFAVSGSQISIVIQDRHAVYPLTIDPIAQEAYLKASNTEGMDEFGTVVATSGNRVVVGAPSEDGASSGVNGSQGNGLQNSGAVYIFEEVGGTWTQQAYLKASNPDASDGFGLAVGISGDRVVVGAPNESSGGLQSDNSQAGAGAAYVFEFVGGAWIQVAYLKASNANATDLFGTSVGVSGDWMVVGAPGESSSAVGVQGDQNNNNAAVSGAAYIFQRVGGVWTQSTYLKASNTGSLDRFGESVAVSGERVVVGAPSEDSSASGVNGNQSDNAAPAAGAAYVYERSSGLWFQASYLKSAAPDANDSFGVAVTISGELIAVGVTGEDGDDIGVDGDYLDNSASGRGAVYVFKRVNGQWAHDAYLKPSARFAIGGFGRALSISGSHLVVGTPGEDGGSMGLNGDQSDQSQWFAGAAYLFERSGGTWSQRAYLKASNVDSTDFFGISVAISEETMVIGAVGEASLATGVNGDQSDNSAFLAGAVYAFDLHASQANYCGSGVLNSTGFPGRMASSGSLVVADNDLTLRAENLPSGVFGYFLSSRGQGLVPIVSGSQGNLCVGGGLAIGRHHDSIQISSGAGVVEHLLDLTNMPTNNQSVPAAPGETWNFQCWYRDSNPASTSNFTDGLSVRF
ncbi:MAG: FG-GAP repeat protein, partial [Planctomycetota bacterium]|nr:FG-GAP repeat protein [Planctomycetota bacterium]